MPGGIVVDWEEEAKNYPEFTKGDIEVFHEAFHQFDADNSGSIDANELVSVLKYFGQKAQPEDISFLVETFDKDKSGVIEWGEFLSMMDYFFAWKVREFEILYLLPAKIQFPYLSKMDVSVCLQIFRQFDEDESESIDAYELGNALKYMGQGVSQEVLERLISRYSTSHDRTLGWVDFLDVVASFYPEKKREFEKTFLRPAKKYPEFSREDIDAMIFSFREFDADDSGSIDVHELRKMYAHLGSPISEEKAQEIVKKFDADNSGSIDWPEFLEIMRDDYQFKREEFESKFLQAASEFPQFNSEEIEILVEAFRTFDEDDSGSIDIHELKSLFTEIGQGCTDAELKRLMDKYDVDGNGTLDWKEFLNIMLEIYQKSQDEEEKPAPKQETTTAAAKTEEPKAAPVKATTPASTSSPKLGVGSHRGATTTTTTTATSNKCPICGKTVYATEAITLSGQNYHKGCFRCQEPGCGLSLTLKNFKSLEDKIWCEKHVPKAKATAVGIEGNMTLASQANAPKIKKEQGIKKDQRMSFAPGKVGPINPDEQ